MSFDSTDTVDYSTTIAAVVSVGAYTVFAVIRPHRDGANNDAWFCPQIIGTVNAFWGLALQNRGSGNKFSIWQDRGAPAPRTNSVESTTSYSQNVWYIVEAWWDGSNMNIRVNQDTTVSEAYNDIASTANTPSMGMESDIAALYTWNVDIGSTNRDSFRTELADWFGISIP